MMKLAFCLFKYYPYGGLERDFLQIAKTCLARGHEIHVFTTQWQGEIPEKFNIHTIKPFGFTNHGRAKSFAKKIAQLNKENKEFDYIMGFNRLPNLDFYFAADPCFAKEAQQKHPVLYKILPRYKIFADLEKSVFSKDSRTKILLLNPAHLLEFVTYYQTPKRRFMLLAPGINEDRKRPDNQIEIRKQMRQQYDIHDDEKILLMVGSDFKRKGLDRALLALDALPKSIKEKTHLWIVGQGDAQPHDRVKYWGPQDNITDFYAAADCLLHPAYQETAGMVLIEALAAGLPVIVTQNCGYAVYIQKAYAGTVIPEPFDQEKLNLTVHNILSNPELLPDYRQNALNYGKSHDLFGLAKQVANVIDHGGFL